MNGVVVVGASAGGLGAAEALRRLGYGGAITLIGDEPDRPYDRPPLSKQVLAGQWEPERLTLRTDAAIAELDLELHLGVPATALDTARRVVTLADDTRFSYDALVVATGVRPRRLPGCPDGVHVLRTLSDALALKERLRPGRRLVIVGAGFVGAEVAATARSLGVEVTLLESGPVPLALAIGSVPNTEWLAGSGLTIHNGLVCDEYCAAAPDVYGVGDVTRWRNPLFGTDMRIEHRTNAAEQGMAVARTLLNPEARKPFAPVPYFWSDQYDVKIQAYGHLRDHDEALVMDSSPGQLLVAYRTGDRLTGVLAAGKSPKVLRAWRARIATGALWGAALTAA